MPVLIEHFSGRNVLAGLALAFFGQFLIMIGSPALAATTTVSQGYKAASAITVGTIVGADSADSQSVVTANIDNRNNLLGVVVDPKESLLNLSSTVSQVQVATGGVVQANVSTINGDIAAGDKIVISPISGVGMKAVEAGKIIGVAQGSFSQANSGAQKKTIKDKAGNNNEVYIGQIPVVVNVSYWTPENSVAANSIVSTLTSFASNIVGKKVSPLKALLGVAVLLIAMLISAIILYSSVSSSIHSIGRNPLSGSAIKRSLFQVILIVFMIMLFSLGAVYLIIGR